MAGLSWGTNTHHAKCRGGYPDCPVAGMKGGKYHYQWDVIPKDATILHVWANGSRFVLCESCAGHFLRAAQDAYLVRPNPSKPGVT